MSNKKMELKRKTSYWQVFRLIFVVFSLYLMGDAFFRWDGFRFYATFSEFLPSVALISIPLIIKEPDRTEGRIINDLTEQIDIPPTILDLADIPAPQWMEGRSLLPLMRGGSLSPMPAFSMNFEKNPSLWHKITRGTVAVWKNDYKLIHYFDATGNKSLLFNLKQDPDEQNNLFEKEPEAGQRLLALIQKNLKEANERISKGK